MADLNQCNFIGRLGADPEIRYMPNGDPVANFSIAVGEKWTDKQTGEAKENTEWVRIVAFRKLAEIIAEYLQKGSHRPSRGRLQSTSKKRPPGFSTRAVSAMAARRTAGGVSCRAIEVMTQSKCPSGKGSSSIDAFRNSILQAKAPTPRRAHAS